MALGCFQQWWSFVVVVAICSHLCFMSGRWLLLSVVVVGIVVFVVWAVVVNRRVC